MKLPKSWSDVTIETFLKYYTISTRKWVDPIDQEINILACFSGQDVKEIEKLKARELADYIKKLSFLSKLPSGRVKKEFNVGGGHYYAQLVMQEMTAAQFMNFSDLLKGVKQEDYIYQMHNLIACMCTKRTYQMKYPFIKYEYDGYLKNSDVFYKNMTMDLAYPFYVFFCKVMDKSLANIQDYLTQVLKKEQKEIKKSSRKKRWALGSIGVGI